MRFSKGVTLLEVLVVLGCFFILSLVSVATWRHYAVKMQQTVLLYHMRDGLIYARSQAVNRQAPMIYCGSSDLLHCDGDWQHAQIVKDKYRGMVLKSYSSQPGSMRVSFRGNLGRVNQLEFTPQGMTYGQQGHFSVCLPASWLDNHSCRRLLVRFSGEVAFDTKGVY